MFKAKASGSGRALAPAGRLAGFSVAIAVTAALLAGCGGDDEDNTDSTTAAPPPSSLETQGPTIVTPEQLVDLADLQPIYWAGERPGTELELTVNAAGAVFIRYLPEGAAPGSADELLTVSTYPAQDAYDALQAEARGSGARTESLEDGRFVLVSESQPTNVYFAYPDTDFQVEVFDPSPDQSLGLVVTGEIQPVL